MLFCVEPAYIFNSVPMVVTFHMAVFYHRENLHTLCEEVYNLLILALQWRGRGVDKQAGNLGIQKVKKKERYFSTSQHP